VLDIPLADYMDELSKRIAAIPKAPAALAP
jgi:hypothetical protein